MKRDPLVIIEEMFKCLEEGRPFSINEMSKQTGIHNITIRRYVRLIERVRSEPKIEIIKTSHSIILRVKT
jgi:response regulator of citrate/malate metabolism